MAQGFSFADAFRPPNQSQDQELGGFSFADALGKQEPTEQPVSPENLAAQPGTYVSPGGAAFVPPRSGRRPTPEAGGGRGFVNPPLVGQPQPDYTIARPEQPRPYKDKREALDDAVNLLEEGADRAKLVEAFGRMGIPWNEIVQHGQKRNSEYFRQQVVPPAQPGQPTLPVQPTGEIRAWEPGFLEKTANVFKRADASFKDMATSFLFSTGAFNADQTAWMLRNNARQRAAAAPSEDIQRGMEAIGRSKTYGEAAEAMLRNPKATMSMLVDSLLVTAPTLAATLALAPAGVAVRAGTTFAGSGSMEYTSVMTDVLQDKGIDLTDAPKVAGALQDPKIIAEMKEKGAKRGLIVGAFDALSMGLAGRFMRPANELIAAGKLSGSAAKKATVAAWGKELALQVGAGGGGEFVAQKATGDNKPADVLMEALAEGVMAPVDVAAALREARLSTPEAQIARAIDLGVAETQFTPEGIRREAAGAAGGVRPMTIAELVRAAPVAVPAAPEPPEAAAPPEPAARVEPALGEPSAAPAGRVEPALGEPPSEPGGRVEPTLTFVPLSEEPGGRVEPTLGEGPVAEGPVRRFEPLAERAPGQVQAIPGMPTGEELAEPEPTVTPVTPAVEAAPEAPTVTFRPTPAAAALPDTPTVAPTTTPKIFEPPPVNLEAEGLPTVEVPLTQLRLSKDVPQFKLGATAEGVVEPLGGKFERVGVAPIQVWRRTDGSMEVISGRHRFDLAKRSGETTIPAQIHDEAQGFDRLKAAILDAELNIRDGQGKVKDYVNYFKESGIDRETAESRGLLARATGKRSFTIANQGSDELIAAVRSDQIGDEAAYYVALNAPGDARLQSVGIKAIMDGKSMNTATNMMQAVKALAGENDTTLDMFGFDDSAMREAEEMAKIASQKQREIQARLSAISGASKNPKLAAEEGIDIRNPEEVKRRIDELRQKKSAWDNWSTNSDLVAEIRAARGVAPPPVTAPPPAAAPAPALELTAPTPQELRTQEEGREQAEEKAIVDREVDLFQLQPQVVEREAPPEADLFAGEAAPSAEYQAALEKSRRAGEAFRRVQEAYRKQQISDEDFLAGRREYDRAMAEFDRATRKERGEPEPEAKREEGPELDSTEYIISMPRFKYREDEATRGRSNSPAMQIDTTGMTPESLLSKYGEKNVRLLAGLYGIKVKDPKNLARKLIDLRTAIAEASVMTEPQLNSMKLPELKEFAKEIGSPTSGNKPQIIQGILKFAPSTIKLFNDRLQDSKHRTAVLRAAREGKPIKDEVLKDYPDIAVYVYERGTDNYKKAISALALKYRPSVGMEMKTVAEGFRKDAQETQDPKEREVFNDIADEMDRQYEVTFGAREEPARPEGAPTEEQVKNETEFLQDTTQNALEAIEQDFMVGDLVRFGNTPGVVIGLEGDYARFRPDGARSPKAYQRVPKKSLTFVSRPDTTSEVSYSKEQDNKFGDEAGQLNADKSNLIRLLGANMYQSSLSDVAIKELLQNAFDAVKGATASVNAEGKKIKPIYKTGNIEITIDRENRTISVKDDARGMTPDIVRKAFFTIAGSDKSDLPPELRSGGLGLAKMGFMLGSETLQLNTVRDGVRVTVDASAADIASDNFKIKKAPAPKGEHGTTVTVKIPENYIDPKTGDPKPIYFPYSLRSVDSFEKPLVGPVELKVTLKGYGGEETSVLPVGINFPQDKYTKFKANFDWGSADIYFSVDRNTGSAYSIKHQVLSSGVYQFSPSFALDNEKIPYDIIVDVKPNVDARHPDYPFENSRERFKGRLEKDVEALTMYLGQIARGYEARDLQESFKGVVSMPRVEAGAEIAGMAEKLKKTFGTQAAAKPAELKPLPKEITVTADSVTDTKTQQILVDVKAKEAEKKKEATFKGEAAPKALDFMIELKQDPKLPVFHNNTNVDFLAIGRPYGEPEKFFAELGTLLVEMKEEMAKSGMYGYEKLAPENLFFAGVSIDKQYGGVHIKVPYKAVFINPFYSFGARTLFGVRQQLLNTMIHEIAHTGSMDHGVAHNTNMVKVEQYLSDEGLLDYYRDALLDILRRHESAFTAMREAYGQSTTRNTAKSLEDYGKDAAAASARGDRGGAEYAPSAVSARGRPERGEGVPEAEAAGREGAVGRGAGEPAVIEVDGVSRPTTNSRGQRIHPTDEGLRNFWRWFGDSQVVDSQGRPLVVYHGTGFTQAGDAITTFQISAGLYGAGAYFSGNPERAASYARAGQGTIYPVYVRLVNPISIDGYMERFEGTTRSEDKAWDARQELLNEGVDGVLSEPRGPTRFWEVVAFNENQIKSAVGNLGTFSPTSPSILENIEPMAEPSLAEQEGDLIFGREALREYQIKEYAKLRRELGKVPKKVAAGEAGIDMQRNVTRLMQAARELQASIRGLKPRRDSAEVFLAKALTEYDAGNLERDVLDVIQTAYQRAPELLEGLLLQVRSPAKPGISRSAGDFNPWKRAITLYKGTSGVTEAATIRHELAHTLEQMMTPEQRMAVVQAWGKALQRAIKQNPDELHQRYFKAVLDFLENPTERRLRAAQSLMPSYDMYQFINPSEFWAVNAEKLMAAELGSAWDKFKRAVRKMLEGIKKVLGFDNRYDVHKVFNQVMGGSKERITDGVLVDMVKGTGGDFTLLSNIEDDKKLVQKYNRPNTPMLDTSPVKTFITKQFQNGKEFVQDVAENPREAMVGAGDSVMDGLIYLRNKNVWYGSGLEARDFDKYNGELRTAEGVATASVALDNAIRSGNIGVEVIFRGGIEYDPKSSNFVAVKRNLGMKGVYEAEAKMKRKLGDQLGTDIIQGYLEAKRSISIMDELYDRGAAYEAAKDNLQAMKDMGADADQIAQAKDAVEALAKELEAIKKAASSVNMSEEEMYEFASLDEKHPELRDLMDNWTAINQNLLKFWRQVGLLSQGRYETLAAIKDYVPWYRIMEDELDLHDADQSAVQSTTRSMTNIGREKLFKRGKPMAVVDFRAQAGQKDFKIQPSSVVKVEVNGEDVDPDLVSVTPTGEVRLDMDLQDNDLVVFTTNREIQNIIDNMTRNVMRMTMNGIRQFAANRIVLEYASRDAKNKIMVFPSVDKEKGRFNWIVNGKKVVVEIQDPLVAASIYGMENLNLRMWAPLAAVANLTRRTITLSGVFQIKQVFKDAPTAAIVTGVKNPLALIGGVWKGFLTSLTNTDPAVDILKAAGIGGFMSPARTPEAEIKRRLGIMNRNVFSAVIKGLDHIGDSSDMAQRVATYKRVLAETGDETQALYQAANVINFLHHGSAGYAQAVVKVVPFMGAYANAMDVLVRALVGGGLKGMSRKKALARLAITMSLLTGATLLYAMLAGGDPEYDELDDQTKLKNIIIPGTKIMLPMNTSAAYFFKAIPELIYNAVTRQGTENEMDRRRIRKALADSARDMLLGPEPIPAGVKPVLEVAINHDFFTGRPVIPEGLKDVQAAEQYTAATSELGKKISAMLEIPGTDGKRVISPIEADHLVRGIFGTAGAMGQWVSNSIGAIAESRPEPTAREAPITGSFLRDEVPRGREDLFYDFKEAVFEKYKTWQKMVDREDFEGADKYIEKHGDVAAMYEYINETEAELKEINSEIRRLGETRSKDESPKERRQQIDDYRRLRQEILEPVKELRREVLR